MSIQEIAVSHNQKKKLLKAINDESVLFQEDNGDIVVSVEAYLSFKEASDSAPIEAIVGDEAFDFKNQYIIFS